MTKKMLVKTESVDMTWGVAGRGGGFWGVMSEERESWCKGRDVNESFLKKQKKAMFSFLLKCHFNRVKKKPSSSFFTHTHTHTDKLENTQIPSCDNSGETGITLKEFMGNSWFSHPLTPPPHTLHSLLRISVPRNRNRIFFKKPQAG